MSYTVVLVGRPNVGKSTLFNRLTRTRDALVANLPGLTRDRIYGEIKMPSNSKAPPCLVVDTGGIVGYEEGVEVEMAGQSWQAVLSADCVLFMVDANAGLTPGDLKLAEALRQTNKNIYLIVNKIDGKNHDLVAVDFYEMGFVQLLCISAEHNRGIKQLVDTIVSEAENQKALIEPDYQSDPQSDPQSDSDSEKAARGTKITICGKPNVGKSTLVNRLLGEERVVVFDEPGTTRDSIMIPMTYRDRPYTLIDTAGMRRRTRIKEAVEKFSVIKTLDAIRSSDVVVFVIDGRDDISDQDAHLLSFVIDSGRALVLAINKWDGLSNYQKETLKTDLERRLKFVDFARRYFISALHGTGVGLLWDAIDEAYRSATVKVSTAELNRWLSEAVENNTPPRIGHRRIKLRYAHLGGSRPPTIVIHGNQVDKLPENYRRYLKTFFIEKLKLVGTPLRIDFKQGDNPYEGIKNKITPRQIERRKRLIRHRKGKK